MTQKSDLIWGGRVEHHGAPISESSLSDQVTKTFPGIVHTYWSKKEKDLWGKI